MTEAVFALIWGIVISFFFSWKMAALSLCIIPIILISRKLSGKYDPKKPKREADKEKDNQADIMASDCIQHYRTVTAMASEDAIVDLYSSHLENSVSQHKKLSLLTGFFYGMA